MENLYIYLTKQKVNVCNIILATFNECLQIFLYKTVKCQYHKYRIYGMKKNLSAINVEKKVFARYRCAQAHCKNIFSWTCENCGERIKQRNNVQRHKTRCEKKRRLVNARNGINGIVADGEENTVF